MIERLVSADPSREQLGPTIPKEIAPTAAGNTASALPITACAAATNQKLGNKDIATAPSATITAAMTINARFHHVQSIKAPKGARDATVAMPAIIMTTPISPGSQCRLDSR